MVTRADNIVEVPDIKIPGASIHKNELDWDLLIERYISFITRPDKVSPAPENVTINDFFSLVKEALVARQNSEGVPEAHRLVFIEDEPPEEINTEAITYEITRREPGDFGRAAIGEAKVKEVRPHFRSEIEGPDRPGEKLITMGRFYNNWITFSCLAKSNKQARKRLIWFEQMMDAYNWFFDLFGFKPIYAGSTGRERIKLGELPLTKYPVTYVVRTDDTYQFSRQELRNLAINTELSRS